MRFLLLLILSSVAFAQQPDLRTELHDRARQMREDWQHYWHDQDRPLEQAQDAANTAGDFEKAKTIKAQRDVLRQQYEQLVQQRIDDSHRFLFKSGISRRYQTKKSKAVSEDAADFAKFLDNIAESK